MPRTPKEILEDFRYVDAEWSPENLTCDGELSRTEVAAKERKLKKRYEELVKEFGRKPTEAELYPELQPIVAPKLQEPVTVSTPNRSKTIDDMVEDYWLKESDGDLDMMAAEIIKTSIAGIDTAARLRNEDYVKTRMAEYGVKNDFYALARAILKKRGRL